LSVLAVIMARRGGLLFCDTVKRASAAWSAVLRVKKWQGCLLANNRGTPVTAKTARTNRRADVDTLHYGTAKSALGTVLVASGPKGVTAVLIGGDRAEVIRDLKVRFPDSKLTLDQPGQAPFVQEVVKYIEDPRKNVEFELDLRGTAFQKEVWQAVRRIPLGETTTYAALATQIGNSKAVRAVGNACTVNPYAFAVPCHRVLHANPAMSFGHKRGNDRMRPMVAREQKAVSEPMK
jgi:AraC family transcriptional regulator of adaptative response/methylated-DNA-[protein]-cysteine methyltransferase